MKPGSIIVVTDKRSEQTMGVGQVGVVTHRMSWPEKADVPMDDHYHTITHVKAVFNLAAAHGVDDPLNSNLRLASVLDVACVTLIGYEVPNVKSW